MHQDTVLDMKVVLGVPLVCMSELIGLLQKNFYLLFAFFSHMSTPLKFPLTISALQICSTKLQIVNILDFVSNQQIHEC
jgi:hypothetical protein